MQTKFINFLKQIGGILVVLLIVASVLFFAYKLILSPIISTYNLKFKDDCYNHVDVSIFKNLYPGSSSKDLFKSLGVPTDMLRKEEDGSTYIAFIFNSPKGQYDVYMEFDVDEISIITFTPKKPILISDFLDTVPLDLSNNIKKIDIFSNYSLSHNPFIDSNSNKFSLYLEKNRIKKIEWWYY